MRRMVKSFRLSEDQETKEKFRTPFWYYAEDIRQIEKYPYSTFDNFPGGKSYVFFNDNSFVILNETPSAIVNIVNGTNLANATGRTSLINLS